MRISDWSSDVCSSDLFDPLASLRPGFWLSFAAVAILMFTFGARLGPWRWWQTWTRAQWLVAVGLCPILLIFGLTIRIRSAERRGGKECVRKCKARWTT